MHQVTFPVMLTVSLDISPRMVLSVIVTGEAARPLG
jgi:hypothetical protein